MAKKQQPVPEHTLVDLLRSHFPQGQYALLSQVGNSTGTQRSRAADALALGLWPSRGIILHGFEMKSFRSDWLRELENPEKAEDIASRCHAWWIVAADDKIVRDGELPPPWGLFVHQNGALRPVKNASIREDAPAPSWRFLAAILRQAECQLSEEAIRARIEKECVARGFEQGEKAANSEKSYTIDRLRRELERANGIVTEFEKQSGIKFSEFSYADPARLAEAFKEAMHGRHAYLRENLKNAAMTALRILEETSNG